MTGSLFALTANIFVALVFAAAFLFLSRTKATRPGVGWFGLSYAIGAATPASELMVHWSSAPDLFVATSFGTFSLGMYAMAYGLAKYYRVRLSTALLALMLGLSLLARAAIWHGPRNTMPYELYYQTPFSVAMLVCAYVLFRTPNKRHLDSVLETAFVVTALHFILKAFMALTLGSGHLATDYVNSRYALFSQALTGLLLVATAICLLLVVMRDTLEAAHRDADIDELSGLFNRRAFDREAGAALRGAKMDGPPCVVLMFDLDHFKQINDNFGHSAGDLVIREFSNLLKTSAGDRYVVARTGGEEFSVLLSGGSASEGLQWADRARAALEGRTFREQDVEYRITVSCGATVARPGEQLKDVMRRSDRALYLAKSRGRNCVARIDGEIGTVGLAASN